MVPPERGVRSKKHPGSPVYTGSNPSPPNSSATAFLLGLASDLTEIGMSLGHR